ncbi:hypothetical protein WBJ53_23160 [Spirosoma sp. SC4-14]|uniref:hypothetical protein n=1 Tax=Spirosoma sp. SC4-14 TaxID=3128900 RepID=UPI0030D4CF44
MNHFLLFVFSLMLVFPSAWAQSPPPAPYPNPEAALQLYESTLSRLHQDYKNQRPLPDLKFFLFGMGNRTKYIYRNGRLINALTDNIEEQWHVASEIIVPSEYLVHLKLENGGLVQIREDETGVWILQTNPARKKTPARTLRPRRVRDTKSTLTLPRFAEHTFGPVLRVLHHEVLINVSSGTDELIRPVPNILTYIKPRYRDAASMAMVLRETGNLELIRNWILALRDPFDRHNHGINDADNLGQVLFLVSLVSDQNHPVVQMARDSISRFQKDTYILGKTNGSEHPVYQTKWLKYGLKSLGLPDPYIIPKQYDSFSTVFWQDYTDANIPGQPFDAKTSQNYPYLVWAQDHFYTRTGSPQNHGMLGNIDYPLSWEQNASGVHYPGLTVLDKDLVKQKLTFPHGWHAAEMFLQLQEAMPMATYPKK